LQFIDLRTKKEIAKHSFNFNITSCDREKVPNSNKFYISSDQKLVTIKLTNNEIDIVDQINIRELLEIVSK